MTHSISYKIVKFRDVYEKLQPLFQAHWEELGYKGGPKELDIDNEMYITSEALGRYLTMVAENDDEEIVGYAGAFITTLPHHKNVKCAALDAFYVVPEYRDGNVGIKLIKNFEGCLEHFKKVTVVRMSSNLNKDVGGFLNRLGYQESEIVYVKTLGV